MNQDLLLSPKFSKKLPRYDSHDPSMANHEDIFNIDVNSFIITENKTKEDFSNANITNSFSEGGDIFANEHLCRKLNNLYDQQ